MGTFSAPHFTNDDAARAYLETLRWPDGPICPHCGSVNHAYAIKPAGTYRCAEKECRGNFTVTMNSPMERSHIALHKWVLAFHLMCSSKKGISAHQLHRTLGITYRSAWFMAHRIRECMRAGGLAPPMGSGGGRVEADETYIGRIKGEKVRPGGHHKNAVLALLDRDTAIHVNTLEGYFSIFKRGMKGVYQHCSEKHLHRYLAEFDFRYNNRSRLGIEDGERAVRAVKGGTGKRLTYRQPGGQVVPFRGPEVR